MKNFILKTTLFAALFFGLIIIFLRFGKMLYYDKEYPMWKSKIEIINTKVKYDHFIIGDSRALAGIIPKVLGKSYYNLALGGGTSLEGFFTLKNLLKHNKIKFLIVSYAPFHFESNGVFMRRSLAFDFFNFQELVNIFFDLDKNNEIFWKRNSKSNSKKMRKGMIKTFLTKAKLHFNYRANLKFFISHPRNRYPRNKNIYKKIKRRRGHYYFGRKKYSSELNREAKVQKFKLKKIFVYSLSKLFDIAKNNNIPVVYVSMPMNLASFKRLKATYINSYNELFRQLKIKYPNVIFDFELFSYKNSYFGDSSHLNSKGAKKFSQELLHKIQTVYLEK